MKFKEGVDLVGVQDVIVQTWPAIDKVHKKLTGREATVTSVMDGVHQEGSLHYKGLAEDIRIWDVLETFKKRLEEALGLEFEVILEKDHIHIEYDPHRGNR